MITTTNENAETAESPQEEAKSPSVDICPTCGFAESIKQETGVNPMECYQCGKCSAGCPIAEITDILPHDFWRMIQLGLEDQLMQSRHIWLCVGCETCSTRCPNKLPLTRVIDHLRQKAVENDLEPSEPSIAAFHKAFLDTVKKHGRLYELGMIRQHKMATGDLFKDFKLGISLFTKGKIKLLAKGVAARNEIREIFEENKR